MRVFVLMQNDFPIAVFATRGLAEAAKADRIRSSGGPPFYHYHIHEFNLIQP